MARTIAGCASRDSPVPPEVTARTTTCHQRSLSRDVPDSRPFRREGEVGPGRLRPPQLSFVESALLMLFSSQLCAAERHVRSAPLSRYDRTPHSTFRRGVSHFSSVYVIRMQARLAGCRKVIPILLDEGEEVAGDYYWRTSRYLYALRT